MQQPDIPKERAKLSFTLTEVAYIDQLAPRLQTQANQAPA
jgi:hypothetical protein